MNALMSGEVFREWATVHVIANAPHFYNSVAHCASGISLRVCLLAGGRFAYVASSTEIPSTYPWPLTCNSNM